MAAAPVAAVLPLLFLLAAAPAEATACPPELRVNVSLDAWKRELERAPPEQVDAVLAQLRLPPAGSDQCDAPKLDRVDVFRANLSGAPAADAVVQVKFSTRFNAAYLADHATGLSAAVRLYRVQVLRPVTGGWCAVGSQLSLDEAVEEPNAGPVDGMKNTHLPMTFTFVHLTHAALQTVEVRRPFDDVSRASSTGVEHQWWNVTDGRLVQVLMLTEADTVCRACDLPYVHTTLAQRGAPPVTVEQRTRSCSEPGGKGECVVARTVFAPTYAPLP